MRPLRICLAASEVAPFAKTGGLADVLTGLGRWLGAKAPAGAGHDVRIFLPCYQRIAESGVKTTPVAKMSAIDVRFPGRTIRFGLRTVPLPQSDVLVHLVDCPELYGRSQIYTSDGDEALRFAFLCRAVLESCQRWQWAPDVVHCNDWHTALLPLYLRTVYAWDRLFAATRTVLTIHNIGYQGVFPDAQLDVIGLGDQRAHLHHGDLREGRFSCLKTGVLHANKLTTVSRTYAKEIQTAELGMGMDELLRTRSQDLVGIVNGVDYGTWDPATDPLIPHHFTAEDLAGKAKMKAALLQRLSLPHDPRAPVFGVVSRLTAQKGFELFADSIPIFLQREDMRLCVLGSGETKHEQYFQWLRDTWPKKVGLYKGFHDELAHWIEAGSDLFLMPSRFEPCGLNQMYSLRYGTPPIVRRTGGLADTVEPWDPATRQGTGFLFDEFSSHALAGTVDWALRNWRDQRGWRQLVQNGMRRDFSWDRQGPEYVALYRSLLPAS
ncbi:MAG: glycogen synthase GlgA [Planctomycetes bacterium]|nr:glycogen synthase GlgA [Planctomycetota bacterium]